MTSPRSLPRECDVVEAVYMQYHTAYLYAAESIEEALRFLESGEEYMTLASVGVYVNAEPRIWSYEGDAPTPAQAEQMRELYREAARDTP